MSNINTGDIPINENIVDGTELARRLERLYDAFHSQNSSASRPPYLKSGGIWSKVAGASIELTLFDGFNEVKIGSVTNGTYTALGNLKLPSGTANGVLYLDGSQVAKSSSALVFDGANLLVGNANTGTTTIGFKSLIIGGGSYLFSNNQSTTNADVTFGAYSTGASAFRFYVGMGGTVFATNTAISGISDQRLKENIRDLNVGLYEIMALKPRLYDWKEGKGANIKNARGFIAQEFEQVFPDLIDEWKDPSPNGEEPYKSVRQDLIPVLVKAIQEQQAIIESQASTIASMEARLTALEGK